MKAIFLADAHLKSSADEGYKKCLHFLDGLHGRGALPETESAEVNNVDMLVIAGDFFENVPAGGDLYLLKAILHDWPDEMAIHILRNCRNAIDTNKNSRVLVIEMVIPDGKAQHPAKIMDLNLLVLTPGGRERTQKEFRAIFRAAGLKWKGLYRSACPLVIMEGGL